MITNISHKQLVQYTVSVLGVLKNLAEFFEAEHPERFGGAIGGHIRHIIEHYEALVYKKSSLIDYDSRERNSLLENRPDVAISHLQTLITRLMEISGAQINESIEVSCAGGEHGEETFISNSSVGRELCFLNSHCVHHLAIIKPICQSYKIPLGEYFGFAPSTIAYLESQKTEAL